MLHAGGFLKINVIALYDARNYHKSSTVLSYDGPASGPFDMLPQDGERMRLWSAEKDHVAAELAHHPPDGTTDGTAA